MVTKPIAPKGPKTPKNIDPMAPKPYSVYLSYAEKEELEDAIKALNQYHYAMSFMHDFESHMRSIYKYGADEAQRTTWEQVKDKYFDLKAEYPQLDSW